MIEGRANVSNTEVILFYYYEFVFTHVYQSIFFSGTTRFSSISNGSKILFIHHNCARIVIFCGKEFNIRWIAPPGADEQQCLLGNCCRYSSPCCVSSVHLSSVQRIGESSY